jgi:calcium/calmodulin-dependent protein kinase (CaM kinase) II
MPNSASNELLTLSQRLLDSIDSQDWPRYARLCDPTLTAFEPEAAGHLVTGMAFHDFYFQLDAAKRACRSSISAPHVRLLGDVAVVTYVRLRQHADENGRASTTASEETRIWQRQDGEWKHVHFHRSLAGHVQL